MPLLHTGLGDLITPRVPAPPTGTCIPFTNTLGPADYTQTSLLGNLGSVYSNKTVGTWQIDIDLQPSSNGVIFEGGASVRGQALYVFNGKLIYEAGSGASDETGPTGPEKNARGYVEWTIPPGLNNYTIELSARSRLSGTSNGGRVWLRVDCNLVASDSNFEETQLAGGNDSTGGGNINAVSTRATQNGGSNYYEPFTNGTLNNLLHWETYTDLS